MENLKDFHFILILIITAVSAMGSLGVIATIWFKLKNLLQIAYNPDGSPAFVRQPDCQERADKRTAAWDKERHETMQIVCRKIDDIKQTHDRVFNLLDKHQDLLREHGELIAAIRRG